MAQTRAQLVPEWQPALQLQRRVPLVRPAEPQQGLVLQQVLGEQSGLVGQPESPPAPLLGLKSLVLLVLSHLRQQLPARLQQRRFRLPAP
jgi:hypothetical protein